MLGITYWILCCCKPSVFWCCLWVIQCKSVESTAEDSVNELEDGDHVQETIKVAQVVTNNCDSTISAGVLNDTVKPMLSAEKHSLMLEVTFYSSNFN
jgi:activating signal cointegrator complex subunit 1